MMTMGISRTVQGVVLQILEFPIIIDHLINSFSILIKYSVLKLVQT